MNDLDMLEAFRNVAIVIGESGVIFQDSAFYLEVVDAAGERIGKRFEDKERERLAVVILALEAVAFATGSLKPTWACSSGCGKASARKVSRLAVPML